MDKVISESLAIGAFLLVVIFIIRRIPKVDLGHSKAFLRRRTLNWLPLGMTYAFLYMGRYNINHAKSLHLITKEQLGIITFWGMLTYGLSFVINGPLADRFGGRLTIKVAAFGSAVMNLVMGYVLIGTPGLDFDAGEAAPQSLVTILSLCYAANMYFQSFGAVSIVKVNASWFHVRERGVLGGVFGILISSGIYFAFDWGRIIADSVPQQWVFWIPAIILFAFVVIDYFLVFDTPSQTGHPDFDTADASSGDDGPRLPVWKIARKMLTNPVIVTIGLIELCSGFLRNGIMKWTYIFMDDVGLGDSIAFQHWGMLLCIAGIMGGVFAGTVSDRLFQSRRGPSATILYAFMIVAILAALPLIDHPVIPFVLAFGILSVIGVHGMLSGTASADFGGRKNAGTAVGMIDGMVYIGSAAQAITFGKLLPHGAAAKDPNNWSLWMWILLPVAVVGFLLCLRIWKALPNAARKTGSPGKTD